MYLTMRGQHSRDRKCCSFCKNTEQESSVVLTANSSPDGAAVASETVAVEPRPIVGPLVHSMKIEKQQRENKGRNMKISRERFWLLGFKK